MSYQLSVSSLNQLIDNSSNADSRISNQLHQLLLQYCLRLRLINQDQIDQLSNDNSDIVASSEELEEAGRNWPSLQVCTLSEVTHPEKPLLGCVIFYPTYSTWVGGRLRLGLVQCDTSLQANKQLLFNLLRSVIDRALDDEDLQRIELLHPPTDADVYGQLVQLGFEDLTRTEEWHFASLDEQGLRNLVSRESKPGINIRLGVESDCAEVMSMIRGLAEFEKLADQVRIDEKQLRRDLFGERQYGRLFIAESAQQPGETLGYALAFDEFWRNGRGVCLEDVFVQPRHRGKGVCSALFSAVAKDYVNNRQCRFMSLCYLAWNADAFDIYRHYGFVDITSAAKPGLHFLRLCRSRFRSALSQALKSD